MAEIILGTIPGTGLWPLKKDHRVSLKGDQLRQHIWIPGLTGTGKTYFMVSWILQAYKQGIGTTVVDPQGGAVDAILSHLVSAGVFNDPQAYTKIMWMQPETTKELYWPFDPLTQPYLPNEEETAKFFLEAMKRIWPQLALHSSLFDRVTLNLLFLLMDCGLPITEGPTILRAKGEALARYWAKAKLGSTADFWRLEWSNAGDNARDTYYGSTQTRFDQLNKSRVFRYSFGQRGKNYLNPREIMDKRKLVLIDLHAVDPFVAELMGALIAYSYQLAAKSRSPRTDLPMHHLWLDEAWQFVGRSGKTLSEIFASTRQWGLFAAILHQDLAQVESHQAMLGALQNTGLKIAFRLGWLDAPEIAPAFGRYSHGHMKKEAAAENGQPILAASYDQNAYTAQQLMDLKKRHACVKYENGDAVEIETLPLSTPTASFLEVEAVKEEYRKRFATPQELIVLPHEASWNANSSALPPRPRVQA